MDGHADDGLYRHHSAHDEPEEATVFGPELRRPQPQQSAKVDCEAEGTLSHQLEQLHVTASVQPVHAGIDSQVEEGLCLHQSAHPLEA